MMQTLHLALRNLTRRRRRSLLAGVTVALGVAAIVFCRAYADGLEQLMLDYVIEARDGAFQVQRAEYRSASDFVPLAYDLDERAHVASQIAASDEVEAVAPRLRFGGLASNGESTISVIVVGVDPAAEARVCPRGPGGASGVTGAGLSSATAEEVVLGAGLARVLRVSTGDTVTLLVQSREGAFDTVDLVVRGTFTFPDATEDKHVATIPLAVAQRLVHMPGRVTAFAVASRDRSSAGIAAAIADVRARLATAMPAVEARPWHELAPYFRDVIAMQDQLVHAIILVVLLLALAGIVNTMLMTVFERTREIGTLLALGWRRRGIMVLFVVEAGLLTAMGAVIGVALGMAVVAFTGDRGIVLEFPGTGALRVHPALDARFVGWSIVAAALAGLAGGVVPARRAAGMHPIEALRF